MKRIHVEVWSGPRRRVTLVIEEPEVIDAEGETVLPPPSRVPVDIIPRPIAKVVQMPVRQKRSA